MKEICKNFSRSHPTYKGSLCELTGKKTKQQGTCENWCQKRS